MTQPKRDVFEKPKEWIVDSIKIKVAALETQRFSFVPKRQAYNEVPREEALKNVIKNVGLLRTGSFKHAVIGGVPMVLARLVSVTPSKKGNILSQTYWEIPQIDFNTEVIKLSVEIGEGAEEMFYLEAVN